MSWAIRCRSRSRACPATIARSRISCPLRSCSARSSVRRCDQYRLARPGITVVTRNISAENTITSTGRICDHCWITLRPTCARKAAVKAASARPTPTMRRPADQPSTIVISSVPGRNGVTAPAATRVAAGSRRRSSTRATTVTPLASIRAGLPWSSSSTPSPSSATIPASARSDAAVRGVQGSGPVSQSQPARAFAVTSTRRP